MELPSVADLNDLSDEAFAAALAPLVEGAPAFLARLAAIRPFGSDAELIDAAREVAHAMPEADQVALLDAHPRIGDPASALSDLSRVEQGDAGVDEAPWVSEELASLNEIYESRFGFRYVVFVAGRPREEIVPLIEAAIRSDRSAELRRGVDDALYIAADRLARLRDHDATADEPSAEPA